MPNYAGRYTQLASLLNAFGSEVAAELEGLSGAALEAYGTELGEVLDGIGLTAAAAAEIGPALEKYKRAVAPMAEPERGLGRMYK